MSAKRSLAAIIQTKRAIAAGKFIRLAWLAINLL
jgi:hypothetical protein